MTGSQLFILITLEWKFDFLFLVSCVCTEKKPHKNKPKKPKLKKNTPPLALQKKYSFYSNSLCWHDCMLSETRYFGSALNRALSWFETLWSNRVFWRSEIVSNLHFISWAGLCFQSTCFFRSLSILVLRFNPSLKPSSMTVCESHWIRSLCFSDIYLNKITWTGNSVLIEQWG